MSTMGTTHPAPPTMPNPMTCVIEIRDQYGTKVYYPACANAHLFAKIAGTKTLTTNTLMAIAELGYTISHTEQKFDWRQVP